MYIRRPCGCRCVQYSILGGKAQGVRAIFLRQWIFSFLVGQGGGGSTHPAGWLAPCGVGLPCRRCTRRGGLPSLPPAAPASSLLYCPHPPDPRSQSALPGGKGAGGMGATKTTNGRDSRRQRRQATLRIPQRQGQPATSRASSRIGYSNGRSSRQRKNTPSPQKKPVSLLTGFPPSCIIIMRKAGVWLGSRHLTQDLNNL